jgi:hypothetical protein
LMARLEIQAQVYKIPWTHPCVGYGTGSTRQFTGGKGG